MPGREPATTVGDFFAHGYDAYLAIGWLVPEACTCGKRRFGPEAVARFAAEVPAVIGAKALDGHAVRWEAPMRSDPLAALDSTPCSRAWRRVPPAATWGRRARSLAAIGGWADIGTRLRWPCRAIPLAEAERHRDVARTLVPELWPA